MERGLELQPAANVSCTKCCKDKRFVSFMHDTSAVFDCGPADTPENGAALFNLTTYRSVARYMCNKGYELFGDDRATCESTGWSAPSPICKSMC